MSEFITTPLIIGGREWSSDVQEKVIDPATGEVSGCYHVATPELVERALAEAAQTGLAWAAVKPWARSRILLAIAVDIRRNAEETAQVMTREVGKPLAEARAEVRLSADAFEWVAGEVLRLQTRTGSTYSDLANTEVVLQPAGIVLALTPWNFPFNLPTRKLAMALGAGCPVILRPAEQAPESAAALVRSCLVGGVPPGAVALLMGPSDVTVEPLMAEPNVRVVTFTGSTAVGKHLIRQGAATVKRLVLELGGHAPFIVLKGADIAAAAAAAASMKFRNAGQVCTSPTRFYVEHSLKGDFIDAFRASALKLVVGSGFDPSVTMGPLATLRHRERTEGLVADATREGAKLVQGGGRPARLNHGFFFEPTIFVDVPASARAMKEEPFAPLALINGFNTKEEAVAQANGNEAGLAGYVYGPPGDELEHVVGALEVGVMGVNNAALSAVDVPFGGVKQSGYGREGGPEGLREFLSVVARHRAVRR